LARKADVIASHEIKTEEATVDLPEVQAFLRVGHPEAETFPTENPSVETETFPTEDPSVETETFPTEDPSVEEEEGVGGQKVHQDSQDRGSPEQSRWTRY
jgi:hypothetical protein